MMRFKFYMQDPQTKEQSVLLYDPAAGSLTDEKRRPVDLSLVNRKYIKNLVYTPMQPLTPEHPARKHGKVTRLKIQLGLGCNYSCTYCCQAGHREEDAKTSKADAQKFIDNLEWLEGNPEKIEFWGGEPMLYWHKLELLVPTLRGRYPDAVMSIVTNGTLLTKERVDALKKWEVRITISHDGPGQTLRGDDPFDNPEWVELIQYAYDNWKVQFNMVLTKKNLDPAAGIHWLRKKLGRPVIANVESIVNVHDVGGSGVMTDEELDQARSNLFVGLVNGELDDVPILNWKITDFLHTLAAGTPSNARGQKCGMDRPDWMAVDLQGNILTCQNVGAESHHKIGNVADIESARLNTAISHRDRPECNQCPVQMMCFGSCMYLNGLEFQQTCRNEYAANLGVLQAVLYYITRKVLVNIEHLDPVAPVRKHIPIVEISNGII